MTSLAVAISVPLYVVKCDETFLLECFVSSVEICALN